MRLDPKKLPSFRSWLLRVHADLFTIARKIVWVNEMQQLSDFEKIVLVLEDRRFLHHGGVDYIACGRELFKALTFRKHGGASTIDMQFVRTATGFRQRTLRRKLYEIFLSIVIQYRYSKLTILRSYLSCAFFGSHLNGATKAARSLFKKELNHVTANESAQLAAMLVYPKPLIPKEEWWTKIRRRANYGQRRMIRLEKSFDEIPRRE